MEKKKKERKPTLIWKTELKLGVAGQYATDAQARAAFHAMDVESKGSLGTEEVHYRYMAVMPDVWLDGCSARSRSWPQAASTRPRTISSIVA